MKKIVALIILSITFYGSFSQSCDKTSCGPEGTKKEEAAVISSMRTDLQSVITKVSKSSVAIDSQLKDLTIEKGVSDDESLLYISQVAASLRSELINKVEPAKLVASLKEYKPSVSSTKQQMVANLKKEIQLLTAQAEKL